MVEGLERHRAGLVPLVPVLDDADKAGHHLGGLQEHVPEVVDLREAPDDLGRQLLLLRLAVLQQLHSRRDPTGGHDGLLEILAAAEPLQQAGQRRLPRLALRKERLGDGGDALGLHEHGVQIRVTAQNLQRHGRRLPSGAGAALHQCEERGDAAGVHAVLAGALPDLDEVRQAPRRPGAPFDVVAREHRHKRARDLLAAHPWVQGLRPLRELAVPPRGGRRLLPLRGLGLLPEPGRGPSDHARDLYAVLLVAPEKPDDGCAVAFLPPEGLGDQPELEPERADLRLQRPVVGHRRLPGPLGSLQVLPLESESLHGTSPRGSCSYWRSPCEVPKWLPLCKFAHPPQNIPVGYRMK
mmetsp:Transcript_15247/g.36283  ORF Transcript_15247/g.36283 Transcript_15247/m.36283 type:complete len:353 (+) Transcript_15247:1141-2199(+)